MGYSQDYSAAITMMPTSVTGATLGANTAQQIAPANPDRKFLTLQVTGLAAVTFAFGAAPSTIGYGICLDGASSAGGQGGSYEFRNPVPGDSIWALSAAGTTVAVLQG